MRDFTHDLSALALNTATLGHSLDRTGASSHVPPTGVHMSVMMAPHEHEDRRIAIPGA